MSTNTRRALRRRTTRNEPIPDQSQPTAQANQFQSRVIRSPRISRNREGVRRFDPPLPSIPEEVVYLCSTRRGRVLATIDLTEAAGANASQGNGTDLKDKSDSSSEDDSELIRCSICLSTADQITNSGRNIQSTFCGHLFCNACVQKYVLPSCPVCKSTLTPDQIHRVYF